MFCNPSWSKLIAMNEAKPQVCNACDTFRKKVLKKNAKRVIHPKNVKKVAISRGRGAHRCHHAAAKCILFLENEGCLCVFGVNRKNDPGLGPFLMWGGVYINMV